MDVLFAFKQTQNPAYGMLVHSLLRFNE